MEERRDRERSRAKRRGVGRQAGGWRVKGEDRRRPGNGGVGTWGGSVVRQRAVSRACGWTGGGVEGAAVAAAAATAAAAGGSAERDRVGLVRRTPQRVT